MPKEDSFLTPMVKITEGAIQILGVLCVAGLVWCLYDMAFNVDPSWWSGYAAVVLGSFLVFLGGIAVLFQISKQLEVISKDGADRTRMIMFMSAHHLRSTGHEEMIDPLIGLYNLSGGMPGSGGDSEVGG